MNTKKTRTHNLPRHILTLALAAAAVLAVCFFRPSYAVDSPRIISAATADGKFTMTWTGNSSSYDVQGTPDLANPSWRTVFSTTRTNAVLSQSGTAGFFRVVDPNTNFTSLVVNAPI